MIVAPDIKAQTVSTGASQLGYNGRAEASIVSPASQRLSFPEQILTYLPCSGTWISLAEILPALGPTTTRVSLPNLVSLLDPWPCMLILYAAKQITPMLFLDYALCASGCILQGGDQSKFASVFPGERLQGVTLKIVPTV